LFADADALRAALQRCSFIFCPMMLAHTNTSRHFLLTLSLLRALFHEVGTEWHRPGTSSHAIVATMRHFDAFVEQTRNIWRRAPRAQYMTTRQALEFRARGARCQRLYAARRRQRWCARPGGRQNTTTITSVLHRGAMRATNKYARR